MKKLDRKYKNRILVLLFSAMFIFISLSPLVPMAEVDSRLMVNSVGIDADEEGVTVTCRNHKRRHQRSGLRQREP